jgi:hypothetical protein
LDNLKSNETDQRISGNCEEGVLVGGIVVMSGEDCLVEDANNGLFGLGKKGTIEGRHVEKK